MKTFNDLIKKGDTTEMEHEILATIQLCWHVDKKAYSRFIRNHGNEPISNVRLTPFGIVAE